MLGVVSIKLKRLSCLTMNGNYIGLLHAWLFLRYDWVSFHANLIGLRSLLHAWEESFGGQVRRVVGVSENEWRGLITGSLSIKDFSLLLDRRLVVFLFYEEIIQWEKKNLHTLWTARQPMRWSKRHRQHAGREVSVWQAYFIKELNTFGIRL